MANAITSTLLGYPTDHPSGALQGIATRNRSPDDSGAWQLGPVPTLDDTPWVLRGPVARVAPRRRRITTRRVLSCVAVCVLVTGTLARLDPWSLGWRHATQPYVNAVAHRVPAWATRLVAQSVTASVNPRRG